MKGEISTLIALQELDSELSGFDREIEKMQQELADREQALKDREAQAVQCREKAAELQQGKKEIKLAGEEAEERIKERQAKMMQVQTSREHQALLKEIEEAKKQIKETEDRLLQAMEQSEAEENKATELENLCKGEKELLVEEADRVQAAAEEINSRRAAILKQREQLAKELPPSRMKRYEKVLKKRNGLAVVKIIDAVCQGCFMTTPPQQYNEILKGEEICYCPSCQRILYHQPEEAPEEADA